MTVLLKYDFCYSLMVSWNEKEAEDWVSIRTLTIGEDRGHEGGCEGAARRLSGGGKGRKKGKTERTQRVCVSISSRVPHLPTLNMVCWPIFSCSVPHWRATTGYLKWCPAIVWIGCNSTIGLGEKAQTVSIYVGNVWNLTLLFLELQIIAIYTSCSWNNVIWLMSV